MVKFRLAIREWNCMPDTQKTRVQFKQFFRKYQQDMRETSHITVEDAGIHYSNMVRDVISGLQESLQQDQVHTEILMVVQAPVDYVTNAVQNTQQQLDIHLQQIQAMMQAIQMQYS